MFKDADVVGASTVNEENSIQHNKQELRYICTEYSS